MKVVWTRAMELRLIALMEDPLMIYREAAKIMSEEFDLPFTKNSCIGKGRKLGIPARMTDDTPKPVTIYDLEYGMCKWPLEKEDGLEKPPFFYCGEPTFNNRSWCKKHYKVAHVKAYSIVDSRSMMNVR